MQRVIANVRWYAITRNGEIPTNVMTKLKLHIVHKKTQLHANILRMLNNGNLSCYKCLKLKNLLIFFSVVKY